MGHEARHAHGVRVELDAQRRLDDAQDLPDLLGHPDGGVEAGAREAGVHQVHREGDRFVVGQLPSEPVADQPDPLAADTQLARVELGHFPPQRVCERDALVEPLERVVQVIGHREDECLRHGGLQIGRRPLDDRARHPDDPERNLGEEGHQAVHGV